MSEEKHGYTRTEEGVTVIEAWSVYQYGNFPRRIYKLKVTVSGVPQRTRTFTNKDSFGSMQSAEYRKAQQRYIKRV